MVYQQKSSPSFCTYLCIGSVTIQKNSCLMLFVWYIFLDLLQSPGKTHKHMQMMGFWYWEKTKTSWTQAMLVGIATLHSCSIQLAVSLVGFNLGASLQLVGWFQHQIGWLQPTWTTTPYESEHHWRPYPGITILFLLCNFNIDIQCMTVTGPKFGDILSVTCR